MRFIYTAARSLAPGHVLGTAYTLAIWPQALDLTDNPVRLQQIANDGSEENMLLRIDRGFSIQTDYIGAPSPLDAWQEFIRSVSGGEAFTFDPYAYALPLNPEAAKLVPGSIAWQKVAPTLNLYTVSFSVRMVDAIV